jgi:hypothetical protein
MDRSEFKIDTIKHPRACENCAFCEPSVFTNGYRCTLNWYVHGIDPSVEYNLSDTRCATCRNFLRIDMAGRMDEVGSIEEFRLLASVGAWEGVSKFVLESKLNSFLCDGSATYKQIKFADAISKATGKLPPTTMGGQLFPAKRGGNYRFDIADSKQLLMKYIGDNVDEFRHLAGFRRNAAFKML